MGETLQAMVSRLSVKCGLTWVMMFVAFLHLEGSLRSWFLWFLFFFAILMVLLLTCDFDFGEPWFCHRWGWCACPIQPRSWGLFEVITYRLIWTKSVDWLDGSIDLIDVYAASMSLRSTNACTYFTSSISRLYLITQQQVRSGADFFFRRLDLVFAKAAGAIEVT